VGSVVEIGLANALVAGAIALVALLVSRLSRRPAMAHALWLLVLVKLVTPPLFSLPVPGWEVAPPVAVVEPTPDEEEPVEIVLAPAPVVADVLVVPEPPRPMKIQDLIPDANGKLPVVMPILPKAAPPVVEKVVAPPAPVAAPRAKPKAVVPPAPAPSPWPGILNLAGVVWVAGAAGWFLVAGYRIYRFHRLLRHARPAPGELQDHAAMLARQMGLSRGPRVSLVPGPIPPLLWAVGSSPRLLFPQTLLPRLDEAGRSALLVHELAHMKRRDHWVRWVELLACGLFWWYPLTWFACRRLHAAEEECCDAWVVSELPGYGAAYAGALLETIDFLSHQPTPLPPAACGIGRVHHLKRRMTMIVRGATPRSLSWTGKLLVLVLLVALPLTPGPARTAAPPAKETPAVTPKVPVPSAKAQAAPMVPVEEIPDEPARFANQPRVVQSSGGAFWACALSPDGKTVAAVAGGLQGSDAGEGTLTLFDLPSGKERACLVSAKPIRSVAFSHDGKTLATGDFDGRIHLRDPATGAVRQTLEGHTSTINSLAFTRDDKTLYSASLDRTIRAWDLATNTTARTFLGQKDWVLSVAVSRDGKRLVTGSTNKTATVWDTATGKVLHTLTGHNHWVEYALFSPDDSQILTASQDALLKVWDTKTGKFVRDLAGHSGPVNSAKFSPDGKKLVSVSHDQTIMLWDIATGKFEARVPSGHAERIYGLDIANDGKTLVTASWDQTVKVFGFPVLTARKTLQPRRYLPEQNYPILTVACSPDGKTLAVGGEEKAVKLIDPVTGRLLHLLEGHEDMVSRVAFSPDGKTVASASFDGTAALWDVATGKRLHVLEGHEGWVFSVAFSPDGLLVATGGYDRTVRLWQTRTGKEAAKLSKHRGGVRAVAFSRDGKQLASGGADKVIRIWDVLQKEVAQSLAGHEDGVRALAFSADGRRLVSGAEDKTVRLWDLATGKQLASHISGDVVRDVAFSPRGQRLASVTQTPALELLDPTNLNSVYALLRNGNEPWTGLVFGPGAQTLYTVGLDRQIREYKGVGDPLRSLVTHGGSGNQMWFALYAPDGKTVAFGGGDRAIEVRPLSLGKNIGHLTGLDDAAYGVAVSPDGTRLAVGSGDKLIRIYDMASRKLVQTLTGHEFRVWTMAWSPDGQSLASAAGSWDKPDEVGEVKVWDVKSGKERRALGDIAASTQTVAWSADGKLLAVGSRDAMCRIYDAASGKTLHTLKGHKGSVRSVVFSPDGDWLATGDDDSVRIWSAIDGTEVHKLKGPANGVNCLDWSRDGRTIAVAGRSGSNSATPGEINLWRVAEGEDGEPAFDGPVKFAGHADAVLACAFSPDGKRLLTGGGRYSTRGEVAVWDVASGKLQYRVHDAKLWVEAVAFSKDGKTAITAGGNMGKPGEVLFWDADAEGGWRVAEAHQGEVACGDYSADGKRLATGGYDGAIKLWEAATGKLLATLAGHKGHVYQIRFSPDGKSIASAGVDGTVKYWDLDATKEPVEITKFGIQATGVSFSPDGKLLAASSGYTNNNNPAGEVRVIEIATGKERPGAWSGKGAQAIAFSPDGKQLATGGVGAKALRLYDVQTGKLLNEVEGANSIRALAFSRDGKQLATAHGTGGRHGGSSVQVWDTATWQEKAALVEHTRLVLGLGFSPDGKHLATASNDNTVKLWAVRATAPMQAKKN
jgi:WD40 repeat protein/beta-lactamase regulating signal transducer with metallopeptidase domain